MMGATDFFTVEVWTLRGLVRYHVLFVIRLSTREVNIAGIVPESDGEWMKQVARNLTDCVDGFLSGCRYLIHDRSTLFTKEFLSILESAGVKSVRLPPRSPNLCNWGQSKILDNWGILAARSWYAPPAPHRVPRRDLPRPRPRRPPGTHLSGRPGQGALRDVARQRLREAGLGGEGVGADDQPLPPRPAHAGGESRRGDDCLTA